jgi:hypothetical protein
MGYIGLINKSADDWNNLDVATRESPALEH